MLQSAPRSSWFGFGMIGLLATAGLLGMTVSGAFACAELDQVDLGTCGNRIHEPEFGEDCDSSVGNIDEEDSCGAPGTATACRFTCTPDAAPPGCRPGWGCGTDGVCRRPDAKFELVTLPGLARGIGDLDGDGRDDLVLRGSQAEVQVAFFTEGRVLAELFVDPARRQISDSPAVQPIVTRMTTDGIDDLALPLIGDDITVRVFTGSGSRNLGDPFVELVTAPFASVGGTSTLYTAFNPSGVPQQICDAGGCTQTLLLSKTADSGTRFAVLDDRVFVPLFKLPEAYHPQNTALARWDTGRSCDTLGVSYRYSDDGSPGNLVEFFPLCAGNKLNQSGTVDPLGTVDPIANLRLSDLEDNSSLELAGQADINADGFLDLLLNVNDNDNSTLDDPQTYVAYGVGDGQFNTRPDLTGTFGLADRATPLIRGHSWASELTEAEFRINRATWPRAMADINQDGHVDFLLTAGVVALSTPNPADQCLIASEAVLAGPPVGPLGEPEWGYSCLLVTNNGLINAETANRADVARNWRSSGSLATTVDLRGDGVPGFAAIDKNKDNEVTGQEPDHTPIDFMDLLWLDESSSQLVLHTLEATRLEQVAAGDIDGDFTVDLVYSIGSALQVIWGPPYDPARATNFSPVGFDTLRVFNEGLASASLGAERDGRLTVFRDGQWPALALTPPENCATRDDCHVRFASGVLGDAVHVDHFAWALGLVHNGKDGEAGGLRPLRPITGEADLGPAYDSVSNDPVGLSELNLSLIPERTTVVSIELGELPDDKDAPETHEVVVFGRTDDGIELAVLRPRIETSPTSDLCSETFLVSLGDPPQPEGRYLCFELITQFEVNGATRGFGNSGDPFVEIADADGDGDLDLTWVKIDNHVMTLRSDGTGTLSLDSLIEFSLIETDPDDNTDDDNRPDRIDWVRWIELDGTGGRELMSGALQNGGSGLIWGINVGFSSGGLDPRGALDVEGLDDQSAGYVGDFDGDGVEDLAIASKVLFGQPVND